MNAFIDSREPAELKNMCAYESKELDQGDFYLPEHDVVVERKEASDFASSITDGRLSEQADRMSARHDHCYIVLEGTPFNLKYSNVGDHSILGMQTSLAVKRGIKLLYSENKEQTMYAVNRLFERFEDGELNQESSHVKTHDTGEVSNVKVAMLSQIDGISVEKASKILNEIYFDDLVELANDYETADADQIAIDAMTSVDGVGDKTAEKVLNALR